MAQFPNNPQARFAKGQVLRAQNRFDEAIAEYETTLALNRNFVAAHANGEDIGTAQRLVGKGFMVRNPDRDFGSMRPSTTMPNAISGC